MLLERRLQAPQRPGEWWNQSGMPEWSRPPLPSVHTLDCPWHRRNETLDDYSHRVLRPAVDRLVRSQPVMPMTLPDLNPELLQTWSRVDDPEVGVSVLVVLDHNNSGEPRLSIYGAQEPR
jgi:hypothetical protein